MLTRAMYAVAGLFCITIASAQSQAIVCDAAKDLSLIGKQGWYFSPLSLATSGDFLPDPSLPYLKRLSDILEAGGTKLILAPTPSKAAVYSDFLPENYKKSFPWDPSLFRSQYADSVNRLRTTGVSVVDLFKVADQMTYLPQRYFFLTDNHWTPYGAQASAIAVADVIKNDKNYNSSVKYKFQTEKSPKEVKFVGISLGKLINQCGNKIDLETRPVFNTKSIDQNLLDDEETAITLLGTSFSNYKDIPTNFSGFLSQYTSLNVANYGIAAGGPFYSAITYFSGEDYVKQHPKYIVWEFLSEAGIIDIAAYRQIIPSVNKQCKQQYSTSFESDKTMIIPVKTTTQSSYIRITAGNRSLLQVKINLRYPNSSESTTLVRRNTETNSGKFYYELKNDKGILPTTVSVSTVGQPASNIIADLCD